jgi:hypothetical protein
MINGNEYIEVYLENGKKRAFAGAIDWPGWCRSDRGEQAALTALFVYGPRYAGVLRDSGLNFQAPASQAAFNVVERFQGGTTTDFGAPDAAPTADTRPFNESELIRSQALLEACWQALDHAVEAASGKQLLKGPRGGGRELDEIVQHVIGADSAYLGRVGWKLAPGSTEDLSQVRQAILEALQRARRGEWPEAGPRGGKYWSPRYFVRRAAWHVLDHAWEIEDRSEGH